MAKSSTNVKLSGVVKDAGFDGFTECPSRIPCATPPIPADRE
ncbi:MAG: hypothetical protein ACFNUE_03155 [Bacteroides sp.]